MQPQEFFEQIIDANKNAYDNTWNAVTNFQEKAEEIMKSAFDNSPLPQEAKDTALKTMDAYKSTIKLVLDSNKAAYENMMNTITAYQENAEKILRAYLDKMPLPKEAKKAFLAPMDVYKESSTQIQKVVEENYTKVEESIEA